MHWEMATRSSITIDEDGERQVRAKLKPDQGWFLWSKV
jgi:hypothetical protein